MNETTGKKPKHLCIAEDGEIFGPCIEDECEVYQNGGSWERCFHGGLRLADELGVEKLKMDMEGNNA